MEATQQKQPLDMLSGPIWNKLQRYALPVAATAILEQLFNASDLAVVGNFTGEFRTIAVAAVGANSPVIGLVINLFVGIALGANVVIASGTGTPSAARYTRRCSCPSSGAFWWRCWVNWRPGPCWGR